MSENIRFFRRCEANPILTAAGWPHPANSVFNAGAVRLADGATLLLCRVEDHRGHSHLCAARSADVVGDWRIDPSPTLMPELDSHPGEYWGIEDPRIVRLEELDRYSVTYTGYSRGGPGVALALTSDFKIFERRGMVMPPHDKDAAVLPRRVNGRWVMLHRPTTSAPRSHIWISYSPDLKHWGDHRVVLMSRLGAWWDAEKIGLGCPLIETGEGWLMLYHGVRRTSSGVLYRLGLALLDLEHPEKCLLRGDEWIFGPEEPYERVGDVGGVVFPCGYTLGDDGDAINLYYGGADSCVALATGNVRELLDWILKNGRPDVAMDVWM